MPPDSLQARGGGRVIVGTDDHAGGPARDAGDVGSATGPRLREALAANRRLTHLTVAPGPAPTG